jgi:hypothetical protein
VKVNAFCFLFFCFFGRGGAASLEKRPSLSPFLSLSLSLLLLVARGRVAEEAKKGFLRFSLSPRRRAYFFPFLFLL